VTCNRHQKQRLTGIPRFEAGYYVTCVLVENHLHGKCGTYMSPDEYREHQAQEAVGIGEDIKAQKDSESVSEEREVESL